MKWPVKKERGLISRFAHGLPRKKKKKPTTTMLRQTVCIYPNPLHYLPIYENKTISQGNPIIGDDKLQVDNETCMGTIPKSLR